MNKRSHNELMECRFQAGQLDRQVLQHIAKVTSMDLAPMEALSPDQIRQRARSTIIENCLGPSDPVKHSQDIKVYERSLTIPIRIYTPEGEGPFPVILFFHGGGWVACDLDTHDNICRVLCNRVKSLVVSVDYRLSPEFKYPAGLEDAYTSLQWVSQHVDAYQGNPEKIGIAGESAGANIAAALCLKTRDEKGPKVASQLLMCPITNAANMDTKSYREFSEGYLLDRSAMKWFITQYVHRDEERMNCYVSPLLCQDLKRLPPTCVFTAEYDVLRDEGEAYARKLKQAGNEVTCIRYNGMVHGFFVRDGIYTNAASVFWDDLAVFQRALFTI